MRAIKDLSGQTFNRLKVLGPDVAKGFWKVRCVCGNEKVVRGSSLTSGNTKSCGCLTRMNPGRPTRPKYQADIPFGSFVQETHMHFKPIRDYLLQKGVRVDRDGTLTLPNGDKEQYPNAYIAFGHALIKCVQPTKA